MPAKQPPKIEALVVNAIRRLQDVQGSSSREISNYISQEYDIPGTDIRRQVQLALQRGLSYGILQRSKGGYYACTRDYLQHLPLGDGTGDGVMEPCPAQPWRFGIQRKRREKRARRRRARLAREKRAKEKRKKERQLRERRKRGRGTRRSRSRRARGRRRSRARRGTRRRRRQVRRRSRRRSRRGRRSGERTRARSRADSGELEMEAVAVESKRNATFKDGDLRESETSIAERPNERDMQGSSQNSQRSNTPDDV